MDSNARLKEIAQRHANELGEYFDSVQILATADNTSGEAAVSLIIVGKGSFYTRWAAMRETVIRWDEYARESARKEQNENGGQP